TGRGRLCRRRRGQPPPAVAYLRPMASTRSMSLRAVITSILVALTIGAIAVSLALVVFTTRLHQTTGDMRSALGSIETAHALERRLLLHARATDPLVRVNLERQLLTDLTTMERLATSPEERRLVSSVRERLGAYL